MSPVVSYPANQYATAALKELRAILAGEVEHLQVELVRKSAALQHVDGVLSIIAPDFNPGTIKRRKLLAPDAYPVPHVTRQVLTALRRHGAPMATVEVAEALAAELHYPPEAVISLTGRVRYALRNLTKDTRKRVTRIGARRDVRWSLS